MDCLALVRQHDKDVCSARGLEKSLPRQPVSSTSVQRRTHSHQKTRRVWKDTHRAPIHSVRSPVFPCPLNIGCPFLIWKILPYFCNLFHSVGPVWILSFQVGVVYVCVEYHGNGCLVPEGFVSLPFLEVYRLCV